MTVNSISTVIVIGAGIFGISAAVQLVRRGVRVTLVNDGPVVNGASGRSLSWLNSARRRSTAYHQLRVLGIDRYRTLSSRFPAAEWLRFDGGLTWDAEADNEIGEAFRHETATGYDTRHVQAEAVRDVTPGVDVTTIPPQGAIFNAGEGWVDLPLLAGVLLEEFTRRSGILLTQDGTASVIVENNRVKGAATASGKWLEADAILLATGAGVPKAVAATTGQFIGDRTSTGLLIRTRPLAHPLRAVLNTPRVAIRPAPGGAFVLDADWAASEVTRRADGTPNVRVETLVALLAEASRVLEGNPVLEVESHGVGAKPIPGDGEPVFGELQSTSGYYVAFSHSGATLGLIAGELLAYEIATDERHPLLAPFRPERFASTA
ncbi:NAD(P)/FAD-dependent oxidoreductase [Rhizobium puerariae]|uniref:NAD(P)/FAD-dependent oxidoreductase n=1 Tax=Rhizobium puerariae TaxID=1585791 RepID=A0ABV6AJF0_9HYPH